LLIFVIWENKIIRDPQFFPFVNCAIDPPVQPSSSGLVGMLMSSSKLFLFSNEAHLNSGVRLSLELYCVIVIKHVAFFTVCARLTMAFTFASSPLNFYISFSGCGCGFGFKQKYWPINGFGEKKAWIGGFVHPSRICALLL